MSIREVELTLIDGTKTTLGKLGKGPVLVVNVASRCGLTPQYEALEALQKKYGPRGFTVVGLPSDQFKQELSSNEAVAEYCSMTWGVTFPMTEMIKVNGRNRHELYKA
jgi:glutathione peroxidase